MSIFDNVDPRVIAGFERLGLDIGSVTSGYRDPEHNRRVGGASGSQHLHGGAFDYSTAGMSREEIIDLIRRAREAGFGGVGVYDGSLHFDIGAERAWGSDYTGASLPEWARAGLVPTGEQPPTEVEERLFNEGVAQTSKRRKGAEVAMALIQQSMPQAEADYALNLKPVRGRTVGGPSLKRLGVASLYDFG